MYLALTRVLLVFNLLLVSCSSVPEGQKPLVLPEVSNPISVKEIWRAKFAGSDEFVFQPAVFGRTLFVADGKGQLSRLDFASVGSTAPKEVWRIDASKSLSGGVSANEAIVVVGTIKGEVIALSAIDGKVLWKSILTSEIIAPASISSDLIVVRSGDNRLFGLDASTGQRKWTFQRPVPSLSVRSTTAPLVVDQLVFAGFPGGKVVALNLKTGAAVWEGTVSLPKGANELERIADVVSSPVIGAKELCAVAHQGRLACFDLSNGNLLWAKEISSAVGLAIDQSSVIVTDDDGVVHALDRTTGASLWKQDKLINRSVGTPLLHHGNVLVADGTGNVHVLSREDGSFRGRVIVGGGMVSAPMIVLDDGVLVQTRNGILSFIVAD